MTAETATRPIMMPANVSMSVVMSAGSGPSADAANTAFCVSSATANMVTSVTPMTTPMAMRLERSGYRRAFSAASRAVADRPNSLPTSRSTGGITSVAPSASPVKEKMPPKNATTTPSGETRPITMPPASSTPPTANRAIATPLRPPLRTCASWDASTAPPSACSGVTVSTRREPAHAAAHVVRATTAAGTTSTGCTTA